VNAQRKAPATAREYLRVSKDPSGRARSTGEQHVDNERLADQQGWTLGEPYTDNSIGASRHTTKVRGDFDKLLDDLARGRFGADVLVLWESSRGSRRVGEWVDLIERCEKAGVRIAVTTHSRVYDPANVRDRRSMLEDAVDSEYESGKTSLRTSRAQAATAAAGRPAGKVAYGYERVYDERTRALKSQDVVADEAKVIREVYSRLRKGESLRSIAADLDRRGVRTRSGTPFTGSSLSAMALNPTYAGLRAHKPGSNGRYRNLDGVTLVDATWQPIIDKSTWYSVRSTLTSRQGTLPGATSHWLTGTAVCHVCDRALWSNRVRGGTPRLACPKGHVRIEEAELDAYVEKLVLAYLRRPDVIEQLRAGAIDDAELAGVRDSLAEARAELTALRAAVSAGRATVASLVAVEPGLVARVEELERRERDLSAPPQLAALITPGKDVARRWKAAPMSARRDVARLLLVPSLLGQLRVTRSPVNRRPTPVMQRVVWRREDGDHGASVQDQDRASG
jgi:site-specific DNA recombinase